MTLLNHKILKIAYMMKYTAINNSIWLPKSKMAAIYTVKDGWKNEKSTIIRNTYLTAFLVCKKQWDGIFLNFYWKPFIYYVIKIQDGHHRPHKNVKKKTHNYSFHNFIFFQDKTKTNHKNPHCNTTIDHSVVKIQDGCHI